MSSKTITIYRYTAMVVYDFHGRHVSSDKGSQVHTHPPGSDFINPESGEGCAHTRDKWRLGEHWGKGQWMGVEWRHTGLALQGRDGTILFQWAAEVESHDTPQTKDDCE